LSKEPKLHHFLRTSDDHGDLWVLDRKLGIVRRQSPEVTAAERQLYTVEDDSGERATWWGWSMTGTMFAMARLRLMTRISSYVTEDVVERLLIGGRPRLLESALPRVISRKTPSRVRLEGER